MPHDYGTGERFYFKVEWGLAEKPMQVTTAIMNGGIAASHLFPSLASLHLSPSCSLSPILQASRSEDMGSVNIYYLPKGNKAWLGPPPPEGAQMGAVGATLQAASCSLLGGFRPDVSSGRGPFPSSGSHSGLCLIGRW